MQAALDSLFIRLSEPFGWVAGVLVLVLTLALVAAMGRSSLLRHWRWRGAVLVMGLGAVALLLAPYVINASRVRSPLGPQAFQRASLVLPVPGEAGAEIGMDLWFPAVSGAERSAGNAGCERMLDLPLAADDGERVPLLLYMARFRGTRDDNIARMEVLASHGYFVAALDDIATDAPRPGANAEEEAARAHEWPYQSLADYERVVALNDTRAGMQADKVIRALDSLAACAASEPGSVWNSAVDYAQVGSMGYSFGGASAAESAVLDPRIAAVASLDGSLYGRAASEMFDAPYLYLQRDEAAPGPDDFVSGPMSDRVNARFYARDLPQHARLAARDGSGAYRIAGTEHASFSDALFEPHLARQWLLNDPISSFDAINAYLLDFLDMHLRGEEPRLIGRSANANSKVVSFEELGLVPGGEFAVPPPDGTDSDQG